MFLWNHSAREMISWKPKLSHNAQIIPEKNRLFVYSFGFQYRSDVFSYFIGYFWNKEVTFNFGYRLVIDLLNYNVPYLLKW